MFWKRGGRENKAHYTEFLRQNDVTRQMKRELQHDSKEECEELVSIPNDM